MSENTHITVHEIFALLRSGRSREGVALLYRHHYHKMYGIAFSIVKKEDVSQDVVHNVIYKLLLLQTDKFPTTSELTWLYTVVKNETYLFLRGNKPKVSLEDVPVEPIVEDRDIHDLVDMDAYYSMIEGLNEQQRQIVTLKVLGGYTHREIAQMLNRPVGTIQWIYNTSVRKLRVLLSSILLGIVLSAVGLIERSVVYFSQMYATPEIPEEVVHIPFDFSIVVFAVLLAALSLVFLLVFKNSHKIPTKAERKNI